MHTIIWDDESTLPPPLLEYLAQTGEIFLGWDILMNEIPPRRRASVTDYESASNGLRRVLNKYAPRGYHCTRLTADEIDDIRRFIAQCLLTRS
jgi:hypothetical protein